MGSPEAIASAIGIAINATMAAISMYLCNLTYFKVFMSQRPWFQVSGIRILNLW